MKVGALVAGGAIAWAWVTGGAGAAVPAAPRSAAAAGPEEALTKAKLDFDLGSHDEAAAGFRALAEDASAPKAIRAEAAVRLGSVRRAAGDPVGAAEAFALAYREHGDDEGAAALLIQEVGGVVPDPAHWKDRWKLVQLGVDVTDSARPGFWVKWPEASWGARRPLGGGVDGSGVMTWAARPAEGGARARVVRFVRRGPIYRGDAISLHFKRGDLQDIFRLFADISGLNVVVSPGVSGTVDLRYADVPWEDALDRILSALGLAYRWNGVVLHIGRAEDLAPRDLKFVGHAMSLDFDRVELKDAFRRVADRGGAVVDLDPEVAGHVTLRLYEVPWDQAFDLLARLNGLLWTRRGDILEVRFPPGSGAGR